MFGCRGEPGADGRRSVVRWARAARAASGVGKAMLLGHAASRTVQFATITDATVLPVLCAPTGHVCRPAKTWLKWSSATLRLRAPPSRSRLRAPPAKMSFRGVSKRGADGFSIGAAEREKGARTVQV